MKNLIYIVTYFIIILGSLTQCYSADSIDKGIKGDWKEAETKWSVFAKEHMDRMEKHEATLPKAKHSDYKFDMKWTDVKGKFIERYLPNYKIYSDTRFTFVLTKEGHIICLGKTWPLNRPFNKAHDFEAKDYSEFIKDLNIIIDTGEKAIEMIHLKRTILGYGKISASYWEDHFKNWGYEAFKKKDIWHINMKYIGPPASIIMPPIWKIFIDKNNHVRSIIEVHLGFCDVNGDGDCNLNDVKMLESLIGECDYGNKFNEIADLDHDGCITKSDRDLLLKMINK